MSYCNADNELQTLFQSLTRDCSSLLMKSTLLQTPLSLLRSFTRCCWRRVSAGDELYPVVSACLTWSLYARQVPQHDSASPVHLLFCMWNHVAFVYQHERNFAKVLPNIYCMWTYVDRQNIPVQLSNNVGLAQAALAPIIVVRPSPAHLYSDCLRCSLKHICNFYYEIFACAACAANIVCYHVLLCSYVVLNQLIHGYSECNKKIRYPIGWISW